MDKGIPPIAGQSVEAIYYPPGNIPGIASARVYDVIVILTIRPDLCQDA